MKWNKKDTPVPYALWAGLIILSQMLVFPFTFSGTSGVISLELTTYLPTKIAFVLAPVLATATWNYNSSFSFPEAVNFLLFFPQEKYNKTDIFFNCAKRNLLFSKNNKQETFRKIWLLDERRQKRSKTIPVANIPSEGLFPPQFRNIMANLSDISIPHFRRIKWAKTGGLWGPFFKIYFPGSRFRKFVERLSPATSFHLNVVILRK